MIERQEVEALLAASEPGSETFLEAMDKLSRRKVAALCRAWLALDEAPELVKSGKCFRIVSVEADWTVL